MTVCLTDERKAAIKEAYIKLVRKESRTIREVARVVGLMTASFPGIKYGPLHFPDLECCKSRAVKESKGSYDCTMKLDALALCDVQWGNDNIDLSDNGIYQDLSLTMTTDASTFEWGATLDSIRTGAALSYEESLEHINVLELTAVLFGLKSLIKQTNKHVKILCDNTTAVHTINNMGHLDYPL